MNDAGETAADEDIQVFSKDSLPKGDWGLYRKKTLTSAKRIDGAFVVETKEGRIGCGDGVLALDSLGNPYPVTTEEFERIYEAL